jgi:hypothetical protein
MNEYRIYWGEAHDNTFQFTEMTTPIDETIRRAASHLDFYAAAYYTACAEAFRPGGHLSETNAPVKLALEGWKSRERLDREWTDLQNATRELNDPGRFVTFPGYEWQGDGSSGDHNVFFLCEGAPVIMVDRLSELYAELESIGMESLAIPHHTGYRPGRRGRDWSVYDESRSPFSEIYSIHGCSETDEEWIGLRRNSHMGPGQGGGTYQNALDRGYHLGAICSTDNWGDMPGHYGNGRMACIASELTRESLWEAFKARRVYGVTGDRIELDFRIDDEMMGATLSSQDPRRVIARVRGSDAIDRIELLRNGRVIATHNHQDTWDPVGGSRYKLRIEAGWGPRPNEMDMADRQWTGTISIDDGAVVGWEPCWISPGQTGAVLQGGGASFGFQSSIKSLQEHSQNADVFEIEAAPEAAVTIELNGKRETASLADLAAGSRILWYRDECVGFLEERAGIVPASPEREDIYWHVAYKAKIHRAIPEAGYTAQLEYIDEELLDAEVNYRIRVEQRNGQRAWSSPIWVNPALRI